MFSTIAQRLYAHVSDAEERCRCFEAAARGMKKETRSGPQDSEAAAKWWWREYCSLKDAIMSLIDGKIRHAYDRAKAVRTPNASDIHWQKASLRTGESQDNLRALLKKEGRKSAGVYDGLNRRIEDLQDGIKRIRSNLVLEMRAFRVTGFGEEMQEMRLLRRGSEDPAGGSDLRLRPPCGYSLEECTCGEASSPPGPVREGSLRLAIEAAKAEAEAEATRSNTAHETVGEDSGAHVNGVSDVGRTSRVGEGSKKRRFVFEGDNEESYNEWRRVARGGGDDEKLPNKKKSCSSFAGLGGNKSSSSSNSLDEIKRQMGKNPLELERRKRALEEEVLAAEGGVRGTAGVTRKGSRGLEAVEPLVERVEEDSHADSNYDARCAWEGMVPHERAEWLEERGRYREAMEWHRRDLAIARSRALDGEVEDERDLAIDVARALRNVGCCLGRLGMTGFEEAKKNLMEACELVGPGGRFPSPVEEQDVVLELGNLWHHRYVLLTGKGIRFLADEALECAVRRYRESRELCVDLVADTNEDCAGLDGGEGDRDACPVTSDGEVSPAISARKHLLRAEYNVGMSLVEQGKYADAIPHLLGVGDGFRVLARSARVKNPYLEGGDAVKDNYDGQRGGKVSVALTFAAEPDAVPLAFWVAALEKDGMSDLGGLYASSLNLLGECLVSSPSRSRASAVGVLKASVEAFIAVGDPVGATEPLEKLMDLAHLKHRGEGIGRSFCSTAEALLRATSEALQKARRDSGSDHRTVEGGVGGSATAIDDVKDALAQVNGLQTRLEEFRYKDVAGREASHAGGIERGSSGIRQQQQQQREELRAGHNSGAHPSASVEVFQHRDVGPPSITSFRRRLRQLKAFPNSPAQAVGVLRARKGVAAHCSKVSSTSRDSAPEMRNAFVEPHAGAAQLGGRSFASGWSDGNFSGLSSGVVSRIRGQGQGGSFAELREAATAAECAWVVAAAVSKGSTVDGRRNGSAFDRTEGEQGGSPAAAYMNMCSFLNAKPNARASARLLLLERSMAVTEDIEPAARTSERREKSTNSQGTALLDLRACRLSGRDVQAILHSLALAQGSGVSKKDVARAAVDARMGDGILSDEVPSFSSAARLSSLLLDDNPGIGFRAVEALWGFSGKQPTVLLSSLQRLELSRCGLIAADLAGLSPSPCRKTVPQGGDSGSWPPVETASAMSLRVLVLRDNPLTRVGASGGVSGIEAARHGLRGLQDLIARAPALETLDVSGCSQLPDGPTSRLYSPKIAEFLASAIYAGLEDRMDNAVSSARVTPPYGGDEDRAQVVTLRLGNNRFSLSSWTDVFRALSSQPPRDLDLSFAYVWHHFPATLVQADESKRPTSSPPENADVREEADGAEKGDKAARQPLFELLAATILPADASGVEILDLTGSMGFLPLVDQKYCEEREEASGGDNGVTAPWCSYTEAFFVAVRDALMSPLCRTVHLSLSGARGPSSWGAGSAAIHVGGRTRRALSPEDVKVLCEATSACASLRCLDLSGSDLSGSLGATVAAAAVACLIRNNHNYNNDCNLEDTPGIATAAAAAGDGASGTGLGRLSLRACRLGVVGLSSVVGALAAAVFVSDDNVRAKTFATPSSRPRRFFLPKFPRYLDLSDNRHPDAMPLSIGLEQEVSPDGLDRIEDEEEMAADIVAGQAIAGKRERDALRELSASFRLLQQQGLASVVNNSSIGGTLPRNRTPGDGRHDQDDQRKRRVVDLSGNRVVFVDWDNFSALDRGIAFIAQ